MGRGTFGAPLMVPAGRAALSASQASKLPSSLPLTVEEMCITWLYLSTSISLVTRTDPASAT